MGIFSQHITVMQLVLMALGLLTSLLIFLETSETKTNGKSWLKRNGIKVALSLIVSFVAVVLGPDTFKILGIDVPDGSNLPLAHAFFSGLLSDALVFGIRRLLIKLSGKKSSDAAAV